MRTLEVFLLGLLFILLSCSSLKESSTKVSYDKFRVLNVGEINTEEATKVLGSPDKIYYLGKENRIVEKSDKGQWIYKDKGLNKLYLYFESDILISKSWNVDEEDTESSIKKVLREFKADWSVAQEPMTNPHAGPTQCYLEDLKRGKMVKVHGYKKKVSEISVWIPTKNEKSIKEHFNKKVGKEFCVAEHCSKVTDPEAWEHNHCEWLKKMGVK